MTQGNLSLLLTKCNKYNCPAFAETTWIFGDVESGFAAFFAILFSILGIGSVYNNSVRHVVYFVHVVYDLVYMYQ